MAREGENANQPYSPEVEAAILRAREGRQVRTDFEFDAERRLVTVVATPVTTAADLALSPPEPVRVGLLWAHLKAALGSILQHEAAELLQAADREMGDPALAERVARMRRTADAKATISGKLIAEAGAELEAVRRAEAERREAGDHAGAGSKGTLLLPDARPLPGFDL